MPDAIFENQLHSAISAWNLDLPPSAISRMGLHFDFMIERNRVMNLTRITDPAAAAVKHYADSLALAAWAQTESLHVTTLLDVGTGAGFPAVPLAIARPDWSVTAIEATGKKADFVREAAARLELTNFLVEHAHAAHWKAMRLFDVVTLRAVADIAKAAEVCERFVHPEGWLAAYKSAEISAEEAASLQEVSRKTQLEPAGRFDYGLRLHDQELNRALFLLRRAH